MMLALFSEMEILFGLEPLNVLVMQAGQPTLWLLCFCCPSAGITYVCHHVFFFKKTFFVFKIPNLRQLRVT